MRIKRFVRADGALDVEVSVARRTYAVVHTGGAYFRIRGYGLSLTDHRLHRPLFTERFNGQHGIKRRRYLHVGSWCVSALRPDGLL